MIDDTAQASALVDKMNASVPIPARPTLQLVDTLRQKGASFGHDPKLEIKKVFYMGDEGGITCDITPLGRNDAILCSVTHLRIHPKHPLAGEIRAYQETRVRRLARGAGFGPGVTTFERKKSDR